MNYEEYDRAPGVRATHIKQGALSMKHMHHAVTGQGLPDTLALRWGRVVHLAVLEPAAFVERVSVFAGRRAGGDWVEHCALYDPDLAVKPAEYEALEAMSTAVHNEPDAHWLIENRITRFASPGRAITGAVNADWTASATAGFLI